MSIRKNVKLAMKEDDGKRPWFSGPDLIKRMVKDRRPSPQQPKPKATARQGINLIHDIIELFEEFSQSFSRSYVQSDPEVSKLDKSVVEELIRQKYQTLFGEDLWRLAKNTNASGQFKNNLYETVGDLLKVLRTKFSDQQIRDLYALYVEKYNKSKNYGPGDRYFQKLFARMGVQPIQDEVDIGPFLDRVLQQLQTLASVDKSQTPDAIIRSLSPNQLSEINDLVTLTSNSRGRQMMTKELEQRQSSQQYDDRVFTAFNTLLEGYSKRHSREQAKTRKTEYETTRAAFQIGGKKALSRLREMQAAEGIPKTLQTLLKGYQDTVDDKDKLTYLQLMQQYADKIDAQLSTIRQLYADFIKHGLINPKILQSVLQKYGRPARPIYIEFLKTIFLDDPLNSPKHKASYQQFVDQIDTQLAQLTLGASIKSIKGAFIKSIKDNGTAQEWRKILDKGLETNGIEAMKQSLDAVLQDLDSTNFEDANLKRRSSALQTWLDVELTKLEALPQEKTVPNAKPKAKRIPKKQDISQTKLYQYLKAGDKKWDRYVKFLSKKNGSAQMATDLGTLETYIRDENDDSPLKKQLLDKISQTRGKLEPDVFPSLPANIAQTDLYGALVTPQLSEDWVTEIRDIITRTYQIYGSINTRKLIQLFRSTYLDSQDSPKVLRGINVRRVINERLIEMDRALQAIDTTVNSLDYAQQITTLEENLKALLGGLSHEVATTLTVEGYEKQLSDIERSLITPESKEQHRSSLDIIKTYLKTLKTLAIVAQIGNKANTEQILNKGTSMFERVKALYKEKKGDQQAPNLVL